MISVPRSPKPSILQKNEARWLNNLRTAINELQQATKQDIKRAQSKVENARNRYQHPEIKNSLVEMFHGKCAYCESKIVHVAYGDIEHFYPKGTYIHKTFDWNNLLFSCQICNNPRHKGTKFPLDGNGNPLLIDPTDRVTDATVHLRFDWNPKTYRASIYGRDDRGREVVNIFDFNGQNGRKELIKHRSKYVKTLFLVLQAAQDGNADAKVLLQEACSPKSEYSAFALALISTLI